MTVHVLNAKSEIDQARQELRRQGQSSTSAWPIQILRRIGLVGGINVGDYIKSWDVLTTATFIRKNVALDSPVLDIGAYASEILCVLRRLGYSDLTGIDLDPKIRLMPHGDVVRYEVADFMRTPFESGSFGAITAISVIEHGFQSQPLLREVTRLLRPGGYFIASFDYWPEKIDTAGIKIFNMDWRIFSKAEVLALIDEVQQYDLTLDGEVNLDVHERPICSAEKRYTFAWIAFRKG